MRISEAINDNVPVPRSEMCGFSAFAQHTSTHCFLFYYTAGCLEELCIEHISMCPNCKVYYPLLHVPKTALYLCDVHLSKFSSYSTLWANCAKLFRLAQYSARFGRKHPSQLPSVFPWTRVQSIVQRGWVRCVEVELEESQLSVGLRQSCLCDSRPCPPTK